MAVLALQPPPVLYGCSTVYHEVLGDERCTLAVCIPLLAAGSTGRGPEGGKIRFSTVEARTAQKLYSCDVDGKWMGSDASGRGLGALSGATE